MELMDIAQYLLTRTIPNLVNELISSSENGRISDSQSLEELFHAHGVNMRYLGKVLDKIGKKDNPHIYMIIERVILVKAMKHAFRELMRNCDSVFLIPVLTHALNCIFASSDCRQRLESGQMSTTHDYSASLSTRSSEANKKKNKGKKSKKNATTLEKTATTDLEENVNAITLSPIELSQPKNLSSKPSELWNRILHIALKRYDHIFPDNINNYQPLSLKFNRLATLRDLLLTIGVHIESKDYDFTEKTSVSTESTGSMGKLVLPFQPENIRNITPIIKCIAIVSKDCKVNVEMGEELMMENKLVEALECFHTAAHIILNIIEEFNLLFGQLYGPIHKDHAYCFNKISSIYFKQGDFDNAIHYQKQAISIFKKLYGFDHQSTAKAISTIAYYYSSIKQYNLAYRNMYKSLFIYSLIGGEPHPDCFHTFMNLSLMFQENEQHQASLNCLFEALDRSITVYGKDHVKIAGCYTAVALAHYDIDDIMKAIEYQQKCIGILKLNLSEDDPRVKEALLFQHKFEKTLAEKKKGQTVQPVQEVNSMRSFGSNKNGKSKTTEKGVDQQQFQRQQEENQLKEREILKQKLKIAKINAKQGNRRLINQDINSNLQGEHEQVNISNPNHLSEQTESINEASKRTQMPLSKETTTNQNSKKK